MIYIAKRWKTTAVLLLSLLLAELFCVGGLHAQIKKNDVDFEVLATVTMKKGDNLWNLAQQYYKKPLKWKYIMEMNKIPNEKRIPVGTVIYIPVEDAKKIIKTVEVEIEKKKTVEEQLTEELAKLRDELREAREQLEMCQAKNKELAAALEELQAENQRLVAAMADKEAAIEEKDATIDELEAMLDNVKEAVDKMKAESELEAQEREMRAATQTEKDRRIAELESQLVRCRADVENLEMVRDELKAKVAKAEMAPPMKKKATAESRSLVAAVAIALVGSIIWIASD